MPGPIATALLGELATEATSTRKLLERFPIEKRDFSPHAKSWPMHKLAVHVAQLPSWLAMTMDADELDLSAPWTPAEFATVDELLAIFDESAAAARKSLEASSDDAFPKTWTLRSGETVYLAQPRAEVVRGMCMNHLVHHRAQLTIYYRLCDVPVPGMYGPSADES